MISIKNITGKRPWIEPFDVCSGACQMTYNWSIYNNIKQIDVSRLAFTLEGIRAQF
jgi:hypothetical protein